MTTDDTLWIGQNGEKYGPYTEADVRQWLAEGKLSADALAWRNGMPAWVPLTTLFPSAALPPQPPPPPTPPPVFAARGYATHSGGPAGFGPVDSAEDARAALPAPPSLHWGLVLLFTIFTLGIFGIVWPFIQAGWVRKIDERSKATLLLGIGMACFILGYVFYIAGAVSMRSGSGGGLVGLGGMLLLAYWVLYLVAYFSMAGSMRDKLASRELPLAIGGVTLFFFTMYYLQGQLSWLARWKRTGQTSPRASKGVFWAIFCIVPFVIAILAAISIPAYQDYVIRTQVSEGLVLGDAAKTAMAEYYANNGSMPSDNSAAGLAQSTAISGKYVSSVDISAGRITVSYDTPAANPAIRDKMLVLTPSKDGNGVIHWECSTGTTLPNKDLPVSCRQ